ncbi:MAG: [acyl-carrier-protein] S-malonyltransferase, partial [Schleiferiaceae bacterium]
EIKQNLIDQLTAPVKWTQSVQQMIASGVTDYVECGPGKALQGLVKKIDRSTNVSGVSFE